LEQDQLKQSSTQEIERVRRTAESAAERLKQDHQRQIEYLQNTTEAATERTRKRTEAEIADLRSSVNRLEADLTKVSNLNTVVWRIANERPGKQGSFARSSDSK
jgi:DNA anti-recombination protein RmuC